MKAMMKNIFLVFIAGAMLLLQSALHAAQRPMEYLDRGAVAIKVENGVFLGWRYLGTDSTALGFNIYRDGALINAQPIVSATNYTDAEGTITSKYTVTPVLEGVEDTTGIKTITPWAQQYKEIKLNRPAGGTTGPNKYGSVGQDPIEEFPNGQAYHYTPNDCSVGDMDGDGEYEIVVKWDPSNSRDNSYYGITGNVYLDAYKMDGTQLWRIDLGKNIRAGAHYTQFLVYDFDGDGLAELVCKTAPGTVDGEGNNVIMEGDVPGADYRSTDITQTKGSAMLGTIQKGPEYLTLFNGQTGAEMHTIAYKPPRGNVPGWGDSYANRSDRFLACVAYLDGVRPSAVMCRGYYARTTLVAYNVENKKLVEKWFYDSGTTSGVGAFGQGNHNLSVADVDADGKDEIIYGSCAIDDNGTLLYRTGLGHGDAMHVSDMDPDREGLEVWAVHEDKASAYGYELHDAKTGAILWGKNTGRDIGRGMAADIDARYPGFEMWSTGSTGVYTCKGVEISTKRPSLNFRIYWDGDLQDELLDGVQITKWTGSGTTTLFTGNDVSSCNGTKKTPNLSADILGDWREELILWKTSDPATLRIYTTTIPTSYRLYTLMHDPVYRLGVAWQNVAYNQPPHLGFYIGGGIDHIKQPDIKTIKYDPNAPQEPTGSNAVGNWIKQVSVNSSDGNLTIQSSENIHRVAVYTIMGQSLYQENNINSREFTCPLPGNFQFYIVKIMSSSGIHTAKIMVW
jgi:rhamnogalacturonan endolyase